MEQLYGEDLAFIHHQGFGDFAEGVASGLLELFRRAGIRGGRVVDLGCGGGRWLRRLDAAGYEAVGVDISASLIAIARKTVPRARLHLRSAHEFALPPSAAVTALGEVLSYLPAEGGRPPSLRRLFDRVAAALPRGGLFVFDLFCEAGRREGPVDARSWRAGRDWAVLSHAREERARRRLVREIVSFRKAGRHYRRSQERHLLRVSDRRQVEEWLRSSGFSARSGRRIGSQPLLPRRVAFVARRR